MSNTTTSLVRASCERCRAQKLRCVPSSESDAGAPCQRCVRAKVSESCIFGPRARTGRSGRCKKLSGGVETQPGTARKDDETLLPALPGMGTFTLADSCSPSSEKEASDMLGLLSAENTPQVLGLDDSKLVTGYNSDCSMSDLFQDETKALDPFSADAFLQEPSNLLFGADELAFMDGIRECGQANCMISNTKTSRSIDSGGHAEYQELSLSPAVTLTAGSGIGMEVTNEERPGPLVELTALLAEMSPYEHRLSKICGAELDNYPIGDAIFFSHRFHAILSDYGNLPSIEATSQLSTPTMLLALSCFMTLTRIYSPIFEHLHVQLSRTMKVHLAHETWNLVPSSTVADIHSYRGLRLSQLQPICLCAAWNPTKKAVSMLLSSLVGAEGWLNLPPDVKIIAVPGAETQGEQTTRLKGVGGEKTVLFEESSMAALTNGRLYKTVRQQAKELREKIEEVEELLKRLPEA
ncbi:MAG: hypothetical protein Q9213_000350 [Squamulea squamosa]